jgi:hypothetical protein
MGLNMKEKQAVTREYMPCYWKATKKEKSAILDEFIRLTGYHRKSAVRILGGKQVRGVLVYADGEAVKLKPEKRRSANRKGKRVYTDEVTAALRLVWSFFQTFGGYFPISLPYCRDRYYSSVSLKTFK